MDGSPTRARGASRRAPSPRTLPRVRAYAGRQADEFMDWFGRRDEGVSGDIAGAPTLAAREAQQKSTERAAAGAAKAAKAAQRKRRRRARRAAHWSSCRRQARRIAARRSRSDAVARALNTDPHPTSLTRPRPHALVRGVAETATGRIYKMYIPTEGRHANSIAEAWRHDERHEGGTRRRRRRAAFAQARGGAGGAHRRASSHAPGCRGTRLPGRAASRRCCALRLEAYAAAFEEAGTMTSTTSGGRRWAS